jgi:predicted RNA-binding Zn-ribbon protein involved in translation (DUF1610 family)
MNYIIYGKDPAKDTKYGAMNLKEGTVGVGLVYATLVPDLGRAKGYADELAGKCPEMSFQVRRAGEGRAIYTVVGADLQESMARKLVESLHDIQAEGGAAKYPCPRCGHNRMDPVLVRNALSRRAKVYICSECGTEEALLDMVGEPPLPLLEWGMVKGFREEVRRGI